MTSDAEWKKVRRRAGSVNQLTGLNLTVAYFSNAHNDRMVINMGKVRPVSFRELRLVSNESLCGTVGASRRSSGSL